MAPLPPRPAASSSTTTDQPSHRSRVGGSADTRGAPDGDWGWVVVIASFIINCVVDGVCFSFGVFYIQLLEEFKESSAKTALVGALLPGIYLLIGPVVGGLTSKYGCRLVTIVGSVLASASIFISSYSVDLNMLIVTYGVFTGIGFGMMYLPSIVVLGFYFEKRRALATGIAVCGSGVGTFIFAPFGRLLLDSFGWRGGNQILAGVILNGAVCGAVFRPLHRRRTPPKPQETKPAVAVDRSPEVRFRRFTPKRGLIMQKIIDEKRRQRTTSTGSLDGTIITRDNILIRASDLGLYELLSTPPAKVSTQGTLEAIPEVTNADVRNATTKQTTNAEEVAPLAEPKEVDIATFLHTGGPANLGQGVNQPGFLLEVSLDCSDTFLSDLNLSTEDDVTETDQNELLVSEPVVVPTSQPPSWLSATYSRPETEVEISLDEPYETHGRPLYRYDTFYSGSVIDLPEVKRNPDLTSYASIPSMQPAGSKKPSSVRLRLSPAAAVLKAMLDFSLLRSFTFILLCAGFVLPFLGFFTPFVYLPPYALSLEASPDDATVLLSVIGISNAVSRLAIGFIADRPWVDSVLVHNAALVLAGVITCVVPMLRTYELLCIYAALFGICVAAFVTLKSILMVELLGLQKLTSAFGLVGFFQGISTLVGGTLSGAIFDASGSYVDSFLMAGSLIGIGGLICLPIRKVARWEKRRMAKASHANESVSDDLKKPA